MLDETVREPMVRTLDEMTVMADGLVAFARGHGETEERQRIDLGDPLRTTPNGRVRSVRYDPLSNGVSRHTGGVNGSPEQTTRGSVCG